MGSNEKFCLRWNDYESNISGSFRNLRTHQEFFDVTLASEDDKQIQAHKLILSACSPFFRNLLIKNPHEKPLLYLKGIFYKDLVCIINFMYNGQVNVAQNNLNSFLESAEELKVKGLTTIDSSSGSNRKDLKRSYPQQISKTSDSTTKKSKIIETSTINEHSKDETIVKVKPTCHQNETTDNNLVQQTTKQDDNEVFFDEDPLENDQFTEFNEMDDDLEQNSNSKKKKVVINCKGSEDWKVSENTSYNGTFLYNCQGYVYVKERSSFKAINLRCRLYKTKNVLCKGRAKILNVSQELYITTPHTFRTPRKGIIQPYEIIKEGTTRHTDIYSAQGYGYIQDYIRGQTIYLKCRWFKRCKGRGLIHLPDNLFYKTNDHLCTGIVVDTLP